MHVFFVIDGTRNGRLTAQDVKANGPKVKNFDIYAFLYVDNGTTLFKDRVSMIEEGQLI